MVVNVLAVMAMQQLGFTPQGVDMYYLAKANERNEELDFLETIDFQIDMLVNMGTGCENEYVQYSLDEMANIEEQLNAIVPELKNGTSKAVESGNAEIKKNFPSIYKSMFVDRNNNWIPKIETYLNDAQVEFIIVGLAHLHGEDGVLALLQQNGCTVQQVK